MTEETLEVMIGYILIGGVILSLVVEAYGLYLYYLTTHGFGIVFAPEWRLSGANFFIYAYELLASLSGNPSAFVVMSLGIVILMLTPYVRALASVVFYAKMRDGRFFLITLLVVTILTASLLRH